MYFVTVYVAKGTRKHFGPFTSIEEGDEWASNYICSDEAIQRYGCGRWDNGYMESPLQLSEQ